MSMRTRTAAAMVAGAGLVFCAAGLTGCAAQRELDVAAVTLPDAEAAVWDDRTGLHIVNYHGAVTVVVDPNAAPDIRAFARAGRGVTSWNRSEALAAVDFRAETETVEGRRVVRIQTDKPEGEPTESWVDVYVRVPALGGLSIWNRGGPVDLENVSGSIQVENGPLGNSKGRIVVRTAQPLTEPVLLTTERGDIVYQVTSASSGRFELTAKDGYVQFDSRTARTDSVMTDGRRTEASLNRGENPVVLHTDDGFVRVHIMDDPTAYRNHYSGVARLRMPRLD